MKVKILVADGNEQIRKEVREIFITEGYEIDLVSDGITAIKHLRRYDYDLAVLDIQLPELDGKSVSRQLRKMADIPFVFMSESADEESVLQGYALGAEDYVTKPFSPKEMLARLRVILRRCAGHEKQINRNLVFGPIYIDTISHTVNVDDKKVILTPKEYELLVLLAKNPNQAFSREMLLNDIWGHDYYGTDRTVDTHIKTLREAIKPHQKCISTIRGFGYKFNETSL
ncbi:MAG: response regulator transcription factor [Thermoclostridium sp.]|nr:response regulator transcription factor [Thermoclostridium sp.]